MSKITIVNDSVIIIRTEKDLYKDYNINSYDDLENALKKAKAFDIIKNKPVDIELIKKSNSWLDYYTRYKHKTGYNTEIIDEEYNLLKEMIENE